MHCGEGQMLEVSETMRKDLLRAVHTALRRWHTGKQEELPWGEMLTVSQRLAESPMPDPDLVIKEIVLESLNSMEEQAGGEGAQILRLRFLDGYTATATANRLNLTEDVVYKRQRAAIAELTQLVWQAEVEARSIREARISGRLEIKDPPRLFGVDDKLNRLTAALATEGPPWMVAVVGIGGIGKTSLADAGIRALSSSPLFADIAWVSARQERFVVWNGLQDAPEGRPALTADSLIDAIVEQFEFGELNKLPQASKIEKVGGRLKKLPYLVVIDNLETAADYRALVPDLAGLGNPTKLLLTSRHSLHEYPGVLNLSLDELSVADSMNLLRHEADERGMHDVAVAPEDTLLHIHEVAGGNPLALKLLVGQMHTLSLSRVVKDLRQARGRKVEELYRFIYWRSWQLLSDESRRVLAIMPLVAEDGAGLAQIAAVSELAEEELEAPLSQLASLCLVDVRGSLEARRYGIHRLTETFLLNEVLKWQSGS